ARVARGIKSVDPHGAAFRAGGKKPFLGDLSGSALPILPQSVSRGARISGLPGSHVCYGLSVCSPPLHGSDRSSRPERAFTSRLPTGRSPFRLLDITTTVTGLLCWRDFHPLEWQL